MSAPEVDEVASAISKTFIARRDVKAIQTNSGAYMPVTDNGRTDGNRVGWTMGDLRNHVTGKQTFGHYLLSQENTCKVFAFDLDLEKDDHTWSIINPVTGDELKRTGDARATWKPHRFWVWCNELSVGWDFESKARCEDDTHEHVLGSHPDTVALTALLQTTAFRLADSIKMLLGVPVAIAYSGNKGLHVYGMVGEAPAADIRLAADVIIRKTPGLVASRGNNFLRLTDPDYDAVSIEIFPKQDALDGKDLGNLLRLPCGVNRKSGNDGYFIGYGPFGYLRRIDPMVAIEQGDPWT